MGKEALENSCGSDQLAVKAKALLNLSKAVEPSFSWIGRKVCVEKNLSEGLQGLCRRIAAFFRKVAEFFARQGWKNNSERLNQIKLILIESQKLDFHTLRENRSSSLPIAKQAILEVRSALFYLKPGNLSIDETTSLLDQLDALINGSGGDPRGNNPPIDEQGKQLNRARGQESGAEGILRGEEKKVSFLRQKVDEIVGKEAAAEQRLLEAKGEYERAEQRCKLAGQEQNRSASRLAEAKGAENRTRGALSAASERQRAAEKSVLELALREKELESELAKGQLQEAEGEYENALQKLILAVNAEKGRKEILEEAAAAEEQCQGALSSLIEREKEVARQLELVLEKQRQSALPTVREQQRDSEEGVRELSEQCEVALEQSQAVVEQLQGFFHTLQDVKRYVDSFKATADRLCSALKDDIVGGCSQAQLTEEQRAGLKKFIDGELSHLKQFLSSEASGLQRAVEACFKGSEKMLHGENISQLFAIKMKIEFFERKVIDESSKLCEEVIRHISDYAKINIEKSSPEISLSSSWVEVPNSGIDNSFIDVGIGQPLTPFAEKIDGIKRRIPALFTAARLEQIHSDILWKKGWRSEALKFSGNITAKSSFEPAGSAYSSAAPRNRSPEDAVLPNFFHSRLEPSDNASRTWIVPPLSISRSATLSEFDQRDATLRKEANRTMAKQLLLHHAEQFFKSNDRELPQRDDIVIPLQWVALLTDSRLADLVVRKNADKEGLILEETVEALDYWRGKAIEVRGRNVTFDIRIWNAPCHTVNDAVCMITTAPGRIESKCNGEAWKKMQGDITTKIAAIDRELQSSPHFEGYQNLFAPLLKEKERRRSELCHSNPTDSQKEMWKSAADRLALQLRSEIENVSTEGEKRFLLQMQMKECILDLQSDIKNIVENNLIANLNKLDHNRHALGARILNIGSLLGYSQHMHCRSGKDRTGIGDIEAKLLCVLSAGLGRCPSFWEQERLPTIDSDRELLMKGSGNFDQIPRANLGANLGANISNCSHIPGWGKYSPEQRKQKEEEIRAIIGMAKNLPLLVRK